MLVVILGRSDKNIAFDDLLKLLEHLGFELRIKGSHHILFKTGIEEIVNIQPDGANAKPYQVKQIRELIVKYKLAEI